MGASTGVVAQVERVPGPRGPEPPLDEDATRYLSTAAHLDEAYGRALIRHLLVREDRLPPVADGVDLGTVVRHAVAARSRRLYRDGTIVAAAIVATALGGWPVPCLLAWLAATVLAVRAQRPADTRAVRRSRAEYHDASRADDRPRAGAQAVLLVLVVAGIVLFWLALTHGDLFGLRAVLHISVPSGGTDRLRRLVAPVGALLVSWAAVFMEELSARSTIADRLAPGHFTPGRWLSAEPAWAQHSLAVLGARVAAAQAVRPPLAAATEPFLGAGRPALRRRWLIDLGPASSRSAPFDTEDLLDRVCEALVEGFGPLDPGGPALVLVDDYPVAAGPALATRGDGELPVRLLPMPSSPARGHTSARRFRRVRVTRGPAGLTVTAFIGASSGNGLLQVEVYGYVLAPVAERYRLADRLAPSWGWESVGACAVRAARRTPGRILAAPTGIWRTGVDPLVRRHCGAVARRAAEHGTELDAGARFDPRAAVSAASGEDFFGDEDANLYLAAVERRVRNELRHLLPPDHADF